MTKLRMSGAVFVVLTASCGTTEEVQEPPAAGSYSLTFPTDRAAIVTDGLKLFVFDSTQPKTDCSSLISARRTNQPLPEGPTLLVQSGTLSVCDLLADKPSSHVMVGHGARSILVVGFRQGKDLLVGCNTGVVTEESAPINVTLSPANIATLLPTTRCTKLSEYCFSPAACQ